MGGCCCGEKEEIKGPVTPSSRQAVSVKSEEVVDGKVLTEKQKSLKGGESRKQKKDKQKPKSKSSSTYNQKGLVDEKSVEFRIIKEFLDKKGYDLVVSIGSGAYAEVYKAIERKQQKPVAVKVIDLMRANQDYRDNFLHNEIEVLQLCKHPNIIKMYEIAQTCKRVFMIMEFAANGSLSDLLRDKGPLTEANARVMFSQILSAIYNMQSRRIAHRDLKLENILLTQNMIPKISDFSYAIKYGRNDPKSTTFCGSIPYFSPELLMRQPYDPLISDVWSLGVCFYIMLNDSLPFKLGDDRLMLKKQLTKDWKFRPKVDSKLSNNLKTLIKKMLEPDVKIRITVEKIMEDPWVRDHLSLNNCI